MEISTINQHSEFVNSVWKAYESNDSFYGISWRFSSFSSKISHAAARADRFGFGGKGKLIERSFSA